MRKKKNKNKKRRTHKQKQKLFLRALTIWNKMERAYITVIDRVRTNRHRCVAVASSPTTTRLLMLISNFQAHLFSLDRISFFSRYSAIRSLSYFFDTECFGTSVKSAWRSGGWWIGRAACIVYGENNDVDDAADEKRVAPPDHE